MRFSGISFPVVLGDLTMLILFVLMGKIEHRQSIQTLDTLITIFPMALSWIIAGRITAAFLCARVSTFLSTVKTVLLTTIIATPLGLMLRAALLHKSITFLFFVIAFGFIFLYVMVWRMIYLIYLKGNGR